jgi:hypothetical protein
MTLSEKEPGRTPKIPKLYFLDTGLPVRYPVWTQLKEELRTKENLLPIIPEQKAKTVDIFSAARKISKPIENYGHRVFQRGNLEGLGAAFTIDSTTAPFISVAQSLIATAIYVGENITDPRLTAVTAAGIALFLARRSVKKDAIALEKEHFDASTVGTLMYPFIGNPMAAAIAEHGVNFFLVGTLSPVAIAALVTGDSRIYSASIEAAAIMLPAWYYFVNSAIGRGELDDVINPIKKKRQAFVGGVKNKISEISTRRLR